jgi:creatinine amidohydrolase
MRIVINSGCRIKSGMTELVDLNRHILETLVFQLRAVQAREYTGGISMKRHQFSSYSWQEVGEMDRGSITILIPLGSIEQEGTHLPLGVDTFVAETLANEVAKETHALVGPVLPLGYSEWFLEFSGTISLKLETLTQILREYTSCLIHHGFRKLIFINGHAGNSAAVDLVARECTMSRDARIAMVEIWKIANSMAQEIPDLKENTFKHAGEIMTSVMLYLHPDMVSMDRARVEYVNAGQGPFKAKTSQGPAEFRGVEIKVYEEAKKLTESGIMGDPLSATAKKGEAVFKAMKSYLREMVTHF